MADLLRSKKLYLSPDFEFEELCVILDRIDENLAFRQAAYEPFLPEQQDNVIPPLPSIDELNTIADLLKMSRAPLQATTGVGGIKLFILHLLNLVIRVFEPAQISFNRQIREFLGKLMEALYSYDTQATAMRTIITDLDAKVQSLETINISYQEEIEECAQQIAELREDLNNAMERLYGKNPIKPI